MTQVETLKNFFKVINDTICYLVVLKKDFKIFFDSSELVKKNAFREFKYIARIQHLTIRTLILGIYGCLKESEDYSFQKLLKKIEKCTTEYDINSEEYKLIKQELASLSSHQFFDKISILRNKYFAHLDINREQYDNNITPEDLVLFVELIENYFLKVYEFVNPGVTTSFLGIDDTDTRYLYNALAGYTTCMQLMEEYHMKKIKSIDAELLKKAMYNMIHSEEVSNSSKLETRTSKHQ